MTANSDSKQYVEVLHVQQGKEAWLKARKGVAGVCVGSSLLGSVAGLSKFKTRHEAYLQLVSGKSDPLNPAMAHGHAFEQTCADNFRQRAGCPELHEAGVAWATPANPNFTEKQRPFYAGSIDRWGCACGGAGESISDHMGHSEFFVVECKCPARIESFRDYYGSEDKIKQEHLCQLHLQMALFNLKHIFYTAALVRAYDGRVIVSKGYMVSWTPDYWKFVLRRADPVVRCAIDAFYMGEQLSASELDEEVVKADGEGGEAPPAVEIKTLW